MAKKSGKKYSSFSLHGNHQTQKLFVYVTLDLLIATVLGYVLQPLIVSVLASTITGH